MFRVLTGHFSFAKTDHVHFPHLNFESFGADVLHLDLAMKAWRFSCLDFAAFRCRVPSARTRACVCLSLDLAKMHPTVASHACLKCHFEKACTLHFKTVNEACLCVLVLQYSKTGFFGNYDPLQLSLLNRKVEQP